MDAVVVVLVVGLAAAYLLRRAWRTVAGKGCACSRGAASGGCPAARELGRELERVARLPSRG